MNREKKVIIVLYFMLTLSTMMNIYQIASSPSSQPIAEHGVRIYISTFYLQKMTYDYDVFFQQTGGDLGENVFSHWLNYTHHIGVIIFKDKMFYFDIETGFGIEPINRTIVTSY